MGFRTFVSTLAILGLSTGAALAQDRSILVQSTTSTANSGLYDTLLPQFTESDGHHRQRRRRGHRPGDRQC